MIRYNINQRNFVEIKENVKVKVKQFGRPDHDQQHCYHHAPKVKPKAATAVVELLIVGVRTPETY